MTRNRGCLSRSISSTTKVVTTNPFADDFKAKESYSRFGIHYVSLLMEWMPKWKLLALQGPVSASLRQIR